MLMINHNQEYQCNMSQFLHNFTIFSEYIYLTGIIKQIRSLLDDI